MSFKPERRNRACSPAETAPGQTIPISRRSLFIGAAAMAGSSTLHPQAFANPSSQAPAATTPKTAFVPLDTYLGASKRIVDELQAHENDNYYLSTSFGNTGPNGQGGPIDTWDGWWPNGKPDPSGRSYMNCAGFLTAVFEACGADCDIVGSYVGSSGYNRGNKSNLSRWKSFLDDHASMKAEYSSKEELLASGALQKGDLIIAEPNNWSAPGADCHIMIFWGDSPSEDKVWHSTTHADGVIAGCAPGNAISAITAKHADCYWIHVPLEHTIELLMQKSSAQAHITANASHDAYTLEGASFSVYESYEDGELSGYITSFTTDADGKAEVSLPAHTHVWIREDTAPTGFSAWSEPRRFAIERENDTVVLEDEPCLIRIAIVKKDTETGDAAQGHAQLAGAWYELVDANGASHKAQTAWDEQRGAWTALFDNLPRGKAKIRETSAPTGYLVDRASGPNADGWFEADLTPDTHEILFEVDACTHHEQVIRGDVEGAKYGEAAEEGDVKNPLAGCTFAFWLQDDGTLQDKGYEVTAIVDGAGHALVGPDGSDRRGTLMGSVISREDGRFTSKDLPSSQGGTRGALPFGTYTLVETACPDPAFALMEPVRDIALTKDGQEVFFIIEDRLVASPVRVKKVDAASGALIGVPGTEIELLRKNDAGEYGVVEFELRYPDSTVISTFTLPESGIVQFPERLPQGSYAIREVEAVPPYTLRTEPVYFDVTEDHDWDSNDIIEIELPNEAATGSINALKTDAESGEPVAHAHYEIWAKEDVATPDGTLHHKAGEIITTAETDADGRWSVSDLSLGNGSATYIVKETVSPDGYLPETTEHEVTLTYEDSSVALVESTLEIKEEPCRIVVTKKDKGTGEPIEGVEIELRTPAGDEKSELVTSAKTDSAGMVEFARMARGKTYLAKEAQPRTDLGYPAQDAQASLYLSDEGLWYTDEDAAQEGADGVRKGTLTLENEPTRVVIVKVDSQAYAQAGKAQRNNEDEQSIEAHMQNALIAGGEFELYDEQGNPLPCNKDGSTRWSAAKHEPQTFTHLVPGAYYEVAEHRAPDGYERLKERWGFYVEDTTEVQTVVLENKRVPTKEPDFAKTNDPFATMSIGTGMLAAGSAALLWYSRRRTALENER